MYKNQEPIDRDLRGVRKGFGSVPRYSRKVRALPMMKHFKDNKTTWFDWVVLVVLATVFIYLFGSVVFGCARIQENNARAYYREVLWRLEDIPPRTKSKCGFDYDAPYPAFIPDEAISIPDNPPRLSHGWVVNYNPHDAEKVRHESVHYLLRMKPIGSPAPNVTEYGQVSWVCLDELVAQLLSENLHLRDKLGVRRVRTRSFAHKAFTR